ncbi:MAG: T9SS type A sorting domain-containing protein [Rhodothermaceae bacterium]|nr:T9SS type A sorting domain-containing protein [Rhodothermaceae bacterium]MYD67938.1 T9SS type A sorting domain-containing protein [Rhodothermaceae bacterium]MYJ07944.1 T9SS type A sorting domain-containing protein [Rhodothermaceae bacterium]
MKSFSYLLLLFFAVQAYGQIGYEGVGRKIIFQDETQFGATVYVVDSVNSYSKDGKLTQCKDVPFDDIRAKRNFWIRTSNHLHYLGYNGSAGSRGIKQCNDEYDSSRPPNLISFMLIGESYATYGSERCGDMMFTISPGGDFILKICHVEMVDDIPPDDGDDLCPLSYERPESPINLTGQATGPRTIRLNWNTPPLQDDHTIVHFKVFHRDADAEGHNWKNTMIVADSLFIHENLAPNSSHYYGVQLVTNLNCEAGKMSDIVKVTTEPMIFILDWFSFDTERIQNYPNPFTESTTIVFDLSEPAAVGVQVFDVLGRIVENVPAKWFGYGNHHSILINGESLVPGNYFFRVQIRNKNHSYRFGQMVRA